MSKKDIKPVSRKANVVVQDYANEVLIYDLMENKAFSLNETSAMIWQLCDGNRTVSEIAGNLSGKLNSPIDDDFVWLALEQLKKDNLLENADEVSTDFGGLSRREVIRKVGLATMIALPLVSSLIAPTSAYATSVGACAAGICRCPNATTVGGNCQGNSSAPPTTAGYVNCNTVGGTSTCDCVGPFGADDSGGTGFKTGLGCRTNI